MYMFLWVYKQVCVDWGQNCPAPDMHRPEIDIGYLAQWLSTFFEVGSLSEPRVS